MINDIYRAYLDHLSLIGIREGSDEYLVSSMS